MCSDYSFPCDPFRGPTQVKDAHTREATEHVSESPEIQPVVAHDYGSWNHYPVYAPCYDYHYYGPCCDYHHYEPCCDYHHYGPCYGYPHYEPCYSCPHHIHGPWNDSWLVNDGSTPGIVIYTPKPGIFAQNDKEEKDLLRKPVQDNKAYAQNSENPQVEPVIVPGHGPWHGYPGYWHGYPGPWYGYPHYGPWYGPGLPPYYGPYVPYGPFIPLAADYKNKK